MAATRDYVLARYEVSRYIMSMSMGRPATSNMAATSTYSPASQCSVYVCAPFLNRNCPLLLAVPRISIFKTAKLYCAHQNCSAEKFK